MTPEIAQNDIAHTSLLLDIERHDRQRSARGFIDSDDWYTDLRPLKGPRMSLCRPAVVARAVTGGASGQKGLKSRRQNRFRTFQEKLSMRASIKHIHPVLASRDVTETIAFFARLGFAVEFQDADRDPKYVGLSRDGVALHVQWADQQQWAYPIDRPVYRFLVDDVDAIFQEFVQNAGIPAEASVRTPWAEPKDTPWGTREFHLRDPGQNGLQFYRPLGAHSDRRDHGEGRRD